MHQKRFAWNPFNIPIETHEFDMYVQPDQFMHMDRSANTTLSLVLDGYLTVPQRGDLAVIGIAPQGDGKSIDQRVIPFVILNILYGTPNSLDNRHIILQLGKLNTAQTTVETAPTDEELAAQEADMSPEEAERAIRQHLKSSTAIPPGAIPAPVPKSMPHAQPEQDEGVEDLGGPNAL